MDKKVLIAVVILVVILTALVFYFAFRINEQNNLPTYEDGSLPGIIGE